MRTIAEARERLAIASWHLADLLARRSVPPALERTAVAALDLAADALVGMARLIGRAHYQRQRAANGDGT